MKKNIIAVLIAGSLLIANIVHAEKVIDYGFEDWTGNASTTPNYVFTSYNSDLWADHTSGTEVLSNCNGRTAHSGTYYFHLEWYMGGVNECIGTRPNSLNTQSYVGNNYDYPNQGFGDDTTLLSAITGDTITMRFWFRTTGDWKNQMSTSGSHIKDLKFFRMYAEGSGGDGGSAYVHMICEDSSDTRFRIYQPIGTSYSDYWGPSFYAGSDLQDGNWHSFVVTVKRNHSGGTTGNVTTTVWFDDWEMAGPADGSRTVTIPDFDERWQRIALGQNWSAAVPADEMGMDIDDIEVWNGIPDGTPSTTPPPTSTAPPAPQAWIE